MTLVFHLYQIPVNFCDLWSLKSLSIYQEADDLILINIDEGTVSCSRCHYINVPDTPQAAAQSFKSR